MNISNIYEISKNIVSFVPYHFSPFFRGKTFLPLRVYFEITGMCNSHCIYCCQGEHSASGENDLHTAQVLEIIDRIPRTAVIFLTGGEPLMRSDFAEIFHHAAEKHRCGLITNGSLLADYDLDMFASNRLLNLALSIDSIQPEINEKMQRVSLDTKQISEIIRAIKQNRRRFPQIEIKTTIFRENMADIVSILQFAISIKADIFTLSLPKTVPFQFGYKTARKNDLFSPFPVLHYFQDDDIDAIKTVISETAAIAKRAKMIFRLYPRLDINNLGNLDQLFVQKASFANMMRPCKEPWSGFSINCKGELYPCLNYRADRSYLSKSSRSIHNSQNLLHFRRLLYKNKIFPACVGCCYSKLR